jgi:hypothetical protein
MREVGRSRGGILLVGAYVVIKGGMQLVGASGVSSGGSMYSGKVYVSIVLVNSYISSKP